MENDKNKVKNNDSNLIIGVAVILLMIIFVVAAVVKSLGNSQAPQQSAVSAYNPWSLIFSGALILSVALNIIAAGIGRKNKLESDCKDCRFRKCKNFEMYEEPDTTDTPDSAA
jgi:Kef-type K+ transport system membrane component KefB